jgi:glucosamine 6-phosphate synthetase-like amidotransferase/phosphosugar isomerase protein
MSQMIAAEPALAERLVHRLAKDEAIATLATLVRDTTAAGRPIITTGCGTSEHAAMGIAALLNEALDLPAGRDVRSVQALETLARPMTEGLLIAVSHEGGTHITNEALRAARDAGAGTALITVGDGSPGAELAGLVVRTGEQDQSWCHTVGYLSPLLVGVVLAARLSRSRVDALAIRALLDVAEDPHAAASAASALAASDRLLVAGAGVDYVSARELALKVAEGARLPSAAHELETVLHGHLAAATRWTGLILVLTAPGGHGGEIRQRSARVLTAARALAVPAAAIRSAEVAGSVPEDETPAGRIVLPRIGRVGGVAGSLLGAALALQLLTERLARARGVNPDTLGREDPAQAAAHA